MTGRLASLDGAFLSRTNNVTMSNNNLSVTTFGYGDTILTYDDGHTDNRFWGISDRDVPILIGAAAGAVGLVFLILGAVVIWYCCQFVFQGEGKNGSSMYSFDYEDSEEASVSSEATVPFSDSAYFVSGRTSKSHTKGSSLDDLKRSQSTPLNVVSIRIYTYISYIFHKVSRSISSLILCLFFSLSQNKLGHLVPSSCSASFTPSKVGGGVSTSRTTNTTISSIAGCGPSSTSSAAARRKGWKGGSSSSQSSALFFTQSDDSHHLPLPQSTRGRNRSQQQHQASSMMTESSLRNFDPPTKKCIVGDSAGDSSLTGRAMNYAVRGQSDNPLSHRRGHLVETSILSSPTSGNAEYPYTSISQFIDSMTGNTQKSPSTAPADRRAIFHLNSTGIVPTSNTASDYRNQYIHSPSNLLSSDTNETPLLSSSVRISMDGGLRVDIEDVDGEGDQSKVILL